MYPIYIKSAKMSDVKVSSSKAPKRSFNPSKVIDDRNILQIGKYKCQSIEEVIEIDPGYISWLKTKPWAYTNEAFMAAIKDIKLPDFTFGKYKGRSIEWVTANDEGYLKILHISKYVKDKCPELKIKLDNIYGHE